MTPAKRLGLAVLVVAAATVAVYAQVADFAFLSQWDDGEYVTDNPLVREGLRWAMLPEVFTSFQVGHWHPLTILSHALDVALFGLRPGAHHLVNVLLHAVNAGLLLILLHKATGCLWRAWLVAMLFALHPLRVESVAWVAERKDVLSTLLWLAAMLAHLYGRRVLVVVLFALGCMAKSMLVTLPVALLLLDHWPLHRPWRWSLLWEKVPMFALALPVGVAAIYAQRAGSALVGLDKLGLPERIGNAAVGYWLYLWKTVWPADLAFFYPLSPVPVWVTVLAIVALLATTGLALHQLRRRPAVAVGWLWYVVTLLPVSGVFQAGGQAIADRYSYVPHIGIFIAAVWAVPWQRLATRAAAVPVLAALGVTAFVQTGHWRDEAAVYARGIAVTRDNHVALAGQAMLYEQQGRLDEAHDLAMQALMVAPKHALALETLGNIARKQGRHERAVTLATAAARGLGIYRPLVSHGQEVLESGRPDVAAEYARAALDMAPDAADAHALAGSAAFRLGRLDAAATSFETAMRLAPQNAGYCYNMATLRLKQERPAEAEPLLRQALALNPSFSEASNNLGLVVQRDGRFGEAQVAFAEAVQLDPGNLPARFNLGRIHERQGRLDEAAAGYRAILARDPGNGMAHLRLAGVLEKLGDAAGAAEHRRRARP